jgi:hypothetical protein
MKTNLLLITIISFISCNTPRYIYSPAPPNITYFQKKGDGKVTVYYSGGDNYTGVNASNQLNNGLDIQSAYALSNHFFVEANLYKRSERECFNNENNIFDTSTVNYLRHITDFGGGYYVSLNKKKTITYSTILLLGFGKFAIDDYGLKNGVTYKRYFNNNVSKISWLGGFNFITTPNFKLSFMGRFSWLNYGNTTTNYSTSELSSLHLDNISNTTLCFYEPTFNLQFGFKKLPGILIDISTTSCSNQEKIGASREWNSSIGLTFELQRIFPKK